jgi:hypothetical protein
MTLKAVLFMCMTESSMSKAQQSQSDAVYFIYFYKSIVHDEHSHEVRLLISICVDMPP